MTVIDAQGPQRDGFRSITAIRFAAFALLLAALANLAIWSANFALADYWFRKETLQGTEHAISWVPGRAEYHARLALLSPDENQQMSKEALRRAVVLNPSDARSWIELGLHFENTGEQSLAEQCLLRAAEEDKRYLPRWTLINYYYRRHRTDRFWFWAQQAATMVYGDPTPFFRLCGRIAEDGNLIDRLAIARTDVRTAYLSYLLAQNRLDLILPATQKLLGGDLASDVPMLLTTCDRELEANGVAEALVIWNSLAAHHRIPFSEQLSGQGTRVTNGEFRVPLLQHGFDWRLATIDGVRASTDEGGGLRLTFSGAQPEACEPLMQFVPLEQDMQYDLKFEYVTSNIGPNSGLALRLMDGNSAKTLAEARPVSSESVKTEALSFVTPAGCHFARLALGYKRSAGTTRIQGFLVLRKVELHRRVASSSLPVPLKR